MRQENLQIVEKTKNHNTISFPYDLGKREIMHYIHNYI